MTGILGTFLFFSSSLTAFQSLEDARAYAAKFQETPPIENQNVLNPSFSKFQSENAPSLLSRFLKKISIQKSLWSVYDVERQLVESLKKRTALVSKTISVDPGTQCIIFGPLYGSLHSFIRDLLELKKLGYMDDTFVLKPRTYMVFLGDIADKSPFVLETLSLVLSLINKNPQKIMYLRGKTETDRFWFNGELSKELKERAFLLPNLHSLLTDFFAQLRSEVDIMLTGHSQDFIRLQSHSAEPTKRSKIPLAIIQAEDRLISYRLHKGINIRESKYGIQTWSAFSAPNTLFQDHFQFYFDAFSLLDCQLPLVQSTLSLYNRDVRQRNGFLKAEVFNVVSGQRVKAPGEPGSLDLQKPAVVVAATMDLSRSSKTRGRNLQAGIAAAVQQINALGGINGRLFKVYIEDDKYSGHLALTNMQYFAEKISPLIMCPLGTHTLLASLPLIKEKKIYVLFPLSGSPTFRDPTLNHIINLRVNYKIEARVLATYAYKELLVKKFAFFYQNDDYGQAPLAEAKNVLKELGITSVVEASYQANTVRVSDAVTQILQANPDVIALFSLGPATIQLIKELGVEFLGNKHLLALSPLGEENFKQFLKSIGLKVTIAQAVPNPFESTLEIVKEYRAHIEKLGFLPATYSLEGYIDCSIVAELLKQVKGEITMQSLSQVIQNIKNYHYKGITLNYDPKDRQLAHDLWLETAQAEWIKKSAEGS